MTSPNFPFAGARSQLPFGGRPHSPFRPASRPDPNLHPALRYFDSVSKYGPQSQMAPGASREPFGHVRPGMGARDSPPEDSMGGQGRRSQQQMDDKQGLRNKSFNPTLQQIYMATSQSKSPNRIQSETRKMSHSRTPERQPSPFSRRALMGPGFPEGRDPRALKHSQLIMSLSNASQRHGSVPANVTFGQKQMSGDQGDQNGGRVLAGLLSSSFGQSPSSALFQQFLYQTYMQSRGPAPSPSAFQRAQDETGMVSSGPLKSCGQQNNNLTRTPPRKESGREQGSHRFSSQAPPARSSQLSSQSNHYLNLAQQASMLFPEPGYGARSMRGEHKRESVSFEPNPLLGQSVHNFLAASDYHSQARPMRERALSYNTNVTMRSAKEFEGSYSQSAGSEKGSNARSESGFSRISGSSLSTEDRRQRVLKYWEKKKQRMNRNHVRYHCRKDLAQNRFRYHGRFISKEQMEKIKDQEGGIDEIYDPQKKCTPKTKLIFKVEKNQRSTSACSTKCPSRHRVFSEGGDLLQTRLSDSEESPHQDSAEIHCNNMAEDDESMRSDVGPKPMHGLFSGAQLMAKLNPPPQKREAGLHQIREEVGEEEEYGEPAMALDGFQREANIFKNVSMSAGIQEEHMTPTGFGGKPLGVDIGMGEDQVMHEEEWKEAHMMRNNLDF